MIRKRFSLPALGLAALVAVLSGSPPGSGRAAAQSPAAPAPGEALGVTLAFPGAPTSTIRGEEAAGRFLFSANEVTAALSGTLTFDAGTDSYEIKLRGHSAVFGVESAVVVIDTRLVQLVHPVKGEGSTAMVDLEFLAKVVAPLAGVTFTFDRSTRTLAALRSESAEIGVEATIGAADTTTKVVFRFSAAPTFRVEKGEEQIVLRITGARLVPSVSEKVTDDPRVSRILLRPTELAVVLKEKNLSSNVYALQNPARIVVDVSKVTAQPVATPAAAPGAPAPVPPPAAVPAIDPRVIVLDAGHGGSEEGAKGPTGLLEKEATLALVRALSKVLTAKGYRVVATRDSDVTVGLEDRAAAANSAKADLFISVHCNASRAPAAHGTEVYYLSLDASDRAAEALAENENRTDPTPTPSAEANAALREVDLILWDLAQNQHLAASSRLAEIIQGDFNRLLGITTRGVKQAPFKVLIGVNAPAVLVEVAFITNPDEEKKLRSEEFHAQVAETLLGSLSTYFGKADGTAPVPYVAPTPAIGTKR